MTIYPAGNRRHAVADRAKEPRKLLRQRRIAGHGGDLMLPEIEIAPRQRREIGPFRHACGL
ncbi:MAG: hypothetical protein AB7F08_12105 [Dongiaceae bacterium]